MGHYYGWQWLYGVATCEFMALYAQVSSLSLFILCNSISSSVFCAHMDQDDDDERDTFAVVVSVAKSQNQKNICVLQNIEPINENEDKMLNLISNGPYILIHNAHAAQITGH